jgi:hypothetical protein
MSTPTPPQTPRMNDEIIFDINHFYHSIRNKLRYFPEGERLSVDRNLINLRNSYNQAQHEIIRLNDELTQSMQDRDIAIRDAMGWQEFNADMLDSWKKCTDKYNKWKQRTILVCDANRQLEEENNYFREQILFLQNNNINLPILNMADAAEQRKSRQNIYKLLSQYTSRIPQYTGQEPPDEYFNRIQEAIAFANTVIADANAAHADTFTDINKTDIYKSKMAVKYAPVPAQHNGNVIDTPDRFKAWLRHRYHELTLGSRQASLSKLMQERFLPSDTPDTYEERIRLLLLQDNNPDILSTLWSHLPFELYQVVKIAQPADIDAFFTAVKNAWLEYKPPTFSYRGGQTASSTPVAQQVKDKALVNLESIAEALGYPSSASREPDTIHTFIFKELGNRLGYTNYNLRKKSYGRRQASSNKSTNNCTSCTKRMHTKGKCTKKGRPSKNVNYAKRSEDEEDEARDVDQPHNSETSADTSTEEETDNNTSSDEEEETSRQTYALKKKKKNSNPSLNAMYLLPERPKFNPKSPLQFR